MIDIIIVLRSANGVSTSTILERSLVELVGEYDASAQDDNLGGTVRFCWLGRDYDLLLSGFGCFGHGDLASSSVNAVEPNAHSDCQG
jgi:hypothetical protein